MYFEKAFFLTMILMFGTALPAVSGNVNDPEMIQASEIDRKLAEQMDRLRAPVKSQADLENHLKDKSSPIYALSDGSRQLFLDSLVFRNSGLASFRTVELEAELTPTQIFEILKLFGFQQSISAFQDARVETKRDLDLLYRSDLGVVRPSSKCNDYEGYCVSQGTCQGADGFCCDPSACRDPYSVSTP